MEALSFRELMQKNEYHQIYVKVANGEQFFLYYKGLECFVTEMQLESDITGNHVNFRICLRSKDGKVETGHVSWKNIYEDLSWYSSNSISFIQTE